MSVQFYICALIDTPHPNNPEGALRPAIIDVLLPETVQPDGSGSPAFSVHVNQAGASAGDWVICSASGTRHRLADDNAEIYRLPDRAMRAARLDAMNEPERLAMLSKLAAVGLPAAFDHSRAYRDVLDAAVNKWAPGMTSDDIDQQD